MRGMRKGIAPDIFVINTSFYILDEPQKTMENQVIPMMMSQSSVQKPSAPWPPSAKPVGEH